MVGRVLVVIASARSCEWDSGLMCAYIDCGCGGGAGGGSTGTAFGRGRTGRASPSGAADTDDDIIGFIADIAGRGGRDGASVAKRAAIGVAFSHSGVLTADDRDMEVGKLLSVGTGSGGMSAGSGLVGFDLRRKNDDDDAAAAAPASLALSDLVRVRVHLEDADLVLLRPPPSPSPSVSSASPALVIALAPRFALSFSSWRARFSSRACSFAARDSVRLRAFASSFAAFASFFPLFLSLSLSLVWVLVPALGEPPSLSYPFRETMCASVGNGTGTREEEEKGGELLLLCRGAWIAYI